MASRKPIVLAFIDWYHPGYRAGGPIRSMWNMVQALKDKIDFYIITRNTDYMSAEPYSHITPDTWQTPEAGHFVWYCSAEHTSPADFLKAVQQMPAPNVVYINGVFSPTFSIQPARLVKKGKIKATTRIIAPRGMFAPDALKLKGLKKKLFLNYARLTRLYKPFMWHVTNNSEAAQVQKNANKNHCFVIPNLVDRSHIITRRSVEKYSGHLKMVSVARIAPEKNLKFILEVLHHLTDVELTFDVYGAVYNTTYYNMCLAQCKNLPHGITVNFKGDIPNNILTETLQSYHLLALPTLGENYGHIIAESLMANVPILISERTPWNDIQDHNAGYVVRLDTPDTWVNTLKTLCHMPQQEYTTLCQSVHRYIDEKTKQGESLEAYLKMVGGG
jgi:glycosyltransferase involved in cell wall biosynthesis